MDDVTVGSTQISLLHGFEERERPECTQGHQFLAVPGSECSWRISHGFKYCVVGVYVGLHVRPTASAIYNVPLC